MDKQIEYGIICKKNDEKELIKRINSFLKNEYAYRKTYKWKLNSPSSKFQYEYYYAQFIKQPPRWYFDLKPNTDMNGKRKFENSDAEWILWINKQNVDEYTKEQNADVDVFFEKLINSIQYPIEVLHEYKDGEERIGNM
jgi:hypothetical protein